MSTCIVSELDTFQLIFCSSNSKYSIKVASILILLFKTEAMFADGEGCQLSWTRRMKIIIGIARGLRYLHTELNPPFTISDLNSSAVYLTEDFSPKVDI